MGRDREECWNVRESHGTFEDVMRLEKFDKHEEERMAHNAESVLLLIQSGRSPDASTAADMLGVPVWYLERELEHQTLLQFVRRLSKRRP